MVVKFKLFPAAPKGAGTAQAPALQKATKAKDIGDFGLQDNGNGTYTVLGLDAAGNKFDISGTFTCTVVVDDTTVMTASVTGMLVTVTAATPAPAIGKRAVLTASVVANDGTVGPFALTQGFSVTPGHRSPADAVTTPSSFWGALGQSQGILSRHSSGMKSCR